MPSSTLSFHPEHDREIFAEAPATPAVFALFGDERSEPYVSRTANLRRRLIRVLGQTTSAAGLVSRRLQLRERVRRIEYWTVGSEFESQIVLYSVLRQFFPDRYRQRLRLRPAPLIKLDLANQYPRAYVTTQLTRLSGPSVYYGPFSSRAAAEKFLNDSLDLFLMRRCPDDLHPDPAFPGCIYSEMKMCLAPCFRGCTDDQYAEEVRRVQRYLDSGGQSLERELEAERDRASAGLEFEAAAALHARLSKAHEASGQRPELARRLDQLNGLMIQTSATPGAVTFFRIEQGCIGQPFDFSVGANPAEFLPGSPSKRQPVSMEARISEALEQSPPVPRLPTNGLSDHLGLLKRWFFRTTKAGELFLTEFHGERPPELPMRRVVRGLSRVFAQAAKPVSDQPENIVATS